MPELPEMETYKQCLNKWVAGQLITHVTVNRERTLNVQSGSFIRDVERTCVRHVERRAKHLLFKLDSGNVLLLHLMLGGWMYYGDETDLPKQSAQVIFSFGSRRLYFLDLRLGYLHLLTPQETVAELEHLGPEPLDPGFTVEQFIQRMTRKRGTLKTTLVDQRFIAGIGNCYCDEICFEAELLPTRKCQELKESDIVRLYHSIQTALSEAIRYGGYMEFPFNAEDPLTGGYNAHCKVYDRPNEPCLRCGHLITKSELNARKVFYCPHCQH